MRLWSFAAFGGLAMAVAAVVFPREPRPGRLVPEPDFAVWRAADHRGADSARLAFRLVNTGDMPVRIRAVESGCDCAVPKVEPETVPPGDAGTVAVEATPPDIGERTVRVVLLTDSPVAPEVPLFFRMEGKPRGAFLTSRVGGDLTFVGDWSPEEPRTVRANVYEPPDAARPPEIDSDLPFLEFDFTEVKERRTVDPSMVVHTYIYRVRFAAAPPPGRFQGEVRITDPWDRTRSQRLPVFGETPAPVEIVPARLLLDPSSDDSLEARFRVIVRDPALRPAVEPEPGQATPLTVRAVASEDVAASEFVVGLVGPPEDVGAGVYHLLVRPSPSSKAIRVPVRVHREESL